MHGWQMEIPDIDSPWREGANICEVELFLLQIQIQEALQLLPQLRGLDGGKLMNDELVKALRETDFSDGCPCGAEPMCKDKDCVILQAADAIDELSKQILEMGQVGKFLLDVHKINSKMVAPESVPTDSEWWSQYKALLELLYLPRWIPVTERLPGREWVLCKCRAKIYEVLSLRDGYWHHDPQHQYMSGFVTHWMPLPEPPKEGE